MRGLTRQNSTCPGYFSLRRRRNSGFSIIETLISLLIMSIGVLGATTMQTLSFRGNLSAYYRTQASYIASDMIGRMRANPDAVRNDLYNNMSTGTLPDDPVCISTGCTALELSEQDLREWAQYFTNVQGIVNYQPVLRGGSATLTGDGSDFSIQVNWIESFDKVGISKSTTTNFRM